MKLFHGGWLEGMNPDKWTPDWGMNTKDEFERWKRDLEKEKQGLKDFEGHWGYGIYDYSQKKILKSEKSTIDTFDFDVNGF